MSDGGEPEHLALASFGLEPQEGQVRECGLEALPAAADLAEEAAAGLEMRGRLHEDAAHDVEPVLATRKRERGLVPVFRRQSRHALGVDIGRIGEDEIVAPAAYGREEIAVQEPDAVGASALVDVAARDLERLGGEVCRVDPRRRERMNNRCTCRGLTPQRFAIPAIVRVLSLRSFRVSDWMSCS